MKVKIIFSLSTGLIYCWILSTIRFCAADSNVGICVRHIPNPSNFLKIPCIDVREYITYLEMVEKSTVFIDRSLLIKRILEIEHKVIVITFPSRSGKSVNLNMLKSFFEIRINTTSKKAVPANQSAIYKFFTEGKIVKGFDTPLQPRMYIFGEKLLDSNAERVTTILKNPPMIGAYKNIIDEHLASYPVIYVDLLFQSFFSVPSIVENLKDEIVKVYNNHLFLKEVMKNIMYSNETSEEEKRKAKENLNLFSLYDKDMILFAAINDTDLERSLQVLSKMLYEYFGKPVIILIDGYSSSLEYYLLYQEEPYFAEQKKESASLIQNGIKLLRNFFRKSLTENPYLKKAVLTGSLSINKKDLLADVPDVVHYNTIINDLQEFYGVTEEQLEILFDHFDITSDLREKARDFYNGYIMEPRINLTIYNTWSIINFLNFKNVGKYWIQHTNTFEKTVYWLDLKNMFHIIYPLLHGSGIAVHFEEADFDKKERLFLPRRVSPNRAVDDITQDSINTIISLFCELGLLTYMERVENFDNNFWFRIPNKEIKEGIIDSVKGKANGTTIRPGINLKQFTRRP